CYVAKPCDLDAFVSMMQRIAEFWLDLAKLPTDSLGSCLAGGVPQTCRPMLSIDLTGKRALVAGVADDGGYGFAIAKALAEAGATVCVGTWPPALNIFRTMLDRGKLDESLRMSNGEKLTFEKIYPLDAAYDD